MTTECSRHEETQTLRRSDLEEDIVYIEKSAEFLYLACCQTGEGLEFPEHVTSTAGSEMFPGS